MKNSIKKSIVVLICLFLFTSTLVSINAKENKFSTTEEKQVKTITLYRCGVEGEVESIDVTFEYSDLDELSELIQKKCEELFETDKDLKELYEDILSDVNAKARTYDIGWLFVKSRGVGTHIQWKVRLTVFLKLKIFKGVFPKIASKAKWQIYCKYLNDSRSETSITPIVQYLMGMKGARVINGSHSVYVRKFFGYTSWIGRMSLSPSDVIPRSFVGIARVAICNK